MSRFKLGSSTSLSAYETDEDDFAFGLRSSSSEARLQQKGRRRGRQRPKSSPSGSQALLSPQPSVISPKSSSSLVTTMRQEWRSPHKEMWKRRDHNARHIAGRKQRPQTAPMGKRTSSTKAGKGPKAHARMRQLQHSASTRSSFGFQTPKSSKQQKNENLRPRTAGSALLAKQSLQRIKRSRPRPKTAAQSESLSRSLSLSRSRSQLRIQRNSRDSKIQT